MSATEGLAQVTTYATPIALNLWNSISAFLIVVVLVLALVLFSRYVGRGPFVGLIFSFYSAYALYIAFPYMSYLPSAPAITAVTVHAAVYLMLVLVFYLILRRVVVSDFLFIGSIGLIILSTLATGLMLALAYQVFSVSTVYHFTPALDLLFAPKAYFFYWFSAPAIGLFFLAR